MTFGMNPLEHTITALTIWREARGESREAKQGVFWTIQNRIADKRWPETAYGVCLQPLQFSSFNSNDVNATKWPRPKDLSDWGSWLQCVEIVDSPGPDPTHGANHYFDVSIRPPAWADPLRFTVQLGRLRFFRL